ncbi:hypothetical protein AMTR_s00114p00112110 [Amborella trichopoda]|uniref:Uncharacterized protein n=1 Tax=Amborella trichopoda TaxID=13333 RepID=W1NTS1_AMBTC|nr:hypothetical protein AMTR_s00114p00112110 [Amborella trichopoda]
MVIAIGTKPEKRAKHYAFGSKYCIPVFTDENMALRNYKEQGGLEIEKLHE